MLRGPKRLRLRQLLAIEFLLSVVESEHSYPFEFVCHALTGYRPTGSDAGRLSSAVDLVSDLVTLAETLSGDADLCVDALSEPVFSVAELAQRLDVSTKTIFRWRRRGLVGWRVRGEDRRTRLVFPERSIRRFVSRNSDLVTRGSTFSQLSDAERAAIVARARVLVETGAKTVNAASRVIAAELGRAVETVRLILKSHDDAHPGAGLFNRSAMEVDADDRRLAIWEAFVDGATVPSLSERFDLPAAEVYALVTEMRARQLRAAKIEYVPSPEFDSPDAEREILLTTPAHAIHQPLPARGARVPSELPPYLAQLFRLPLLTAEGERCLFRKMNYLRHKAETLRAAIRPGLATASELDRIEALLSDAADVKQEIVQANLRLVVGIAKRHLSGGADLFELISDGNISLMRAVDRFDYSRGFKFSTYATWAIVKNFARSVPEQRQLRERYQTGREELLGATATALPDEQETDQLHAIRAVLERMLATLDEREQTILRRRFGLEERHEQQTLEQIGEGLGVSKERVRQLEARAMEKLRTEFRDDVKSVLGN
jgi:RNA polymerase sigma factor (sigma-70 family)